MHNRNIDMFHNEALLVPESTQRLVADQLELRMRLGFRLCPFESITSLLILYPRVVTMHHVSQDI